MLRAASLALSALFLIGTSSVASADEIRIAGGSSLDMTTVGALRLAGNRGFFFQTTVSPSGGIFTPAGCNAGLLTCTPGAVIPLTAYWSGNDLIGTAFLDGNSYAVGGLNSPNQMAISFSGAVTLPPLAASMTVSAPFSFTGGFVHSTVGTHTAIETLHETGIATLFLSASNGFPGAWHVDRVLYTVASPVLPPWATEDIDFVGTSGRAAYLNGTFIVDGSGTDIWGSADAFRFVFSRSAGMAKSSPESRPSTRPIHSPRPG
jgi:hypothetical protein